MLPVSLSASEEGDTVLLFFLAKLSVLRVSEVCDCIVNIRESRMVQVITTYEKQFLRKIIVNIPCRSLSVHFNRNKSVIIIVG